jgi:hypothetical protein
MPTKSAATTSTGDARQRRLSDVASSAASRGERRDERRFVSMVST